VTVDTALKPGPLFQDHAAILAQPPGALRALRWPMNAIGGAVEPEGEGAGRGDGLKGGRAKGGNRLESGKNLTGGGDCFSMGTKGMGRIVK
jgi:hypothetical protein